MAKKKRKDKEVARLRREVEALRAQIKVSRPEDGRPLAERKQENKKTKEQVSKESQVKSVVVDIRSDLRKTAILTTVCLGILFTLYLTQSRWLP